MTKAVPLSLRSYFSRPHDSNFDNLGVMAIHSYRHLMNPFSFFLFATLVFLLGGFFSRTSLITGLTLVICGLYLYLSAWYMARNLKLTRLPLPHRCREGDSLRVNLEVLNNSGVTLQGLIIEENFGPAIESKIQLVNAGPVNPYSRFQIQYIKVCDGGMGMHRLGPLETRVSDPLGVFQFRVINEDIIEMETLPKVEALPAIEIGGSPFSTEYGNYTLGQRGLSVNFSSVRPYSPGDSLRHIAWRLSARRGDLLVKEFERAINSQITLVLDLNPNIHLGIKSQSTWEYARDVALAVIAQQLELNNSVRLISNHYFSEMKKGEDHLHHLCIEVSKWHPDIFANSPDLMKWGTGSELLSRTSQLLSPGSTLIYLCPYHQSDFGQSREVLKSFLGEKIHLVVIFIDVNTFVKPLVRKMDWAQLAEVASCRGLKQEMSLLSKFEISSYRVAWGDPIGRGFIGHVG